MGAVMSAALDHSQQRDGQRRVGGTLAAGSAAHAIADQFQSDATSQASNSRGFGSGLPLRTARGVSSLAIGHRRVGSALRLPGRRVTHSRVGWCFNTARDFLEFHALTRAGIRPDHAVALLSQTADHLPSRDTDLPPTTHLEHLSSVARAVDQQPSERHTHAAGSFTQGLGNV